ncbi:GAF domain-containing protein [Taibaiella lutea]|uniref:GAF domain-containing protein n=1 Tax=Taibaiella lutea TaxID=2608001 RepID=A0A5M6CEB6_9BACT|nr:GAF domain-containing protein [Taibaiella lutea]KAA5532212.1 GAF domain-containing protein [Taibaiella lutea]
MAKNYDSEFCGSLPLNNINVIQSYGFLIVIDKESFRIIQISDNIGTFLKQNPSELIGTSLEDILDINQLKELQHRFDNKSKEKIPLTFTVSGAKLLAFAHFKPEYIILELEKPDLVTERSFTSVYEDVKYVMTVIESAETIEEVSRIAVKELKKLTGFDGVMMYRFDSDWNGTVIAQDKSNDALEDYMGHTFPASDIPKQARELYLKNPYRLIPEREYEPVRLYPVVNSMTNAFIDLSDCNLRGVAAVHLEYLKNMNVQASMSIRVIYNGTLWGLLAFHHVTPHYLNFELCSICELISTVISNRITHILHKQRFDVEAELQQYHSMLISRIYAEDDLLTGLLNSENDVLQNMFKANGIAIIFRGKYQLSGEVPQKDFLENMVFWLQSKEIENVFHSDHLSDIFEEATPFGATASGVLVIPINKEKGEYIICFRPEVIQTINWGGNPNKTINFDPDRKKYHPRASFKVWQELIHHTSSPWDALEIKAAENLRTFIYEYTTKQAEY